MSEPGARWRQPLGALIEAVRARTGVDFGSYREATVRRRVEHRMGLIGVRDEAAYLRLLAESPQEAPLLLGRLTIKVSRFFRNAATFELLRAQVLPELRRRMPLRVWSAGCGQGEEAYTLAMLLDEAGIDGEVLGTDVDPVALEAARSGTYGGEASLSELPPALAGRYLEPLRPPNTRQRARWSVRPSVRSRVRFAPHDLTTSAAPGTFDLIACRNVLIYLRPPAQVQVMQRLEQALLPGGYLCLGEAEWLPAGSRAKLQVVHQKSRLFRRAERSPGETA